MQVIPPPLSPSPHMRVCVSNTGTPTHHLPNHLLYIYDRLLNLTACGGGGGGGAG
jgi:hypothetical protein